MRVLLMSPLPPPAGGIATWTNEYLGSEQAKKNEITLINIAVSGKRKRNANRFNLFEEIKRLFVIIKELRKKLDNSKYDIAHINSSCSKFGLIRELICAKMIKRKKIKIVVQFHCDISYMIRNKGQQFILARLLKNVDKIVLLNTSSFNYIKKNTKKKENAFIIPNFIQDDIGNNNVTEIREKVKNIIFVGRVCDSKGCRNIIDIAHSFPDINFKLIGKIENNYKKIELPSNVIMTGEIQNVFNELIKADIFLFPTYTEGFPCALLEAMAVGLPIITTKVGAIPDMIEDKGGIYCRINNNKDIVDSIKKLENNINIRKNMSNWNIQKVKKKYLKSNVLNQLFNIYSDK